MNQKTTMTLQEWIAEGERRFGQDRMNWIFVCPSCGYIASVRQWFEAGALEGEVAFSCVGRHLNADGSQTFKRAGGPCDYAGGGLFRLNPIRVEGQAVFAFADLLLLPAANPDLIFISAPFGSLAHIMDIAIDDIKFRHKTDTSYGLLCWPFKINGAWTAVIGRCE